MTEKNTPTLQNPDSEKNLYYKPCVCIFV